MEWVVRQMYSYRMYSCCQLGFRTSYLDENKPLEYFEQKNDTVRFAFKKKNNQATALNMAEREFNPGDRIQGRTNNGEPDKRRKQQ